MKELLNLNRVYLRKQRQKRTLFWINRIRNLNLCRTNSKPHQHILQKIMLWKPDRNKRRNRKNKNRNQNSRSKRKLQLTNKTKWRNQIQISLEKNWSSEGLRSKPNPSKTIDQTKLQSAKKLPKPRHKEDIGRGHSKGGGSKCAGDLGHPSINCEDPTGEQNKHRGRNWRFIRKTNQNQWKKKKERKQKFKEGNKL